MRECNEYDCNKCGEIEEIRNRLKIILQCKAIINEVYFGDDSIEYWDIIFDKGEAFLADDLET